MCSGEHWIVTSCYTLVSYYEQILIIFLVHSNKKCNQLRKLIQHIKEKKAPALAWSKCGYFSTKYFSLLILTIGFMAIPCNDNRFLFCHTKFSESFMSCLFVCCRISKLCISAGTLLTCHGRGTRAERCPLSSPSCSPPMLGWSFWRRWCEIACLWMQKLRLTGNRKCS